MNHRKWPVKIGCWVLAIAIVPAQATSRALDPNEMLMIRSMVDSICNSVSTNGHVVNAALEGGIKARITKLVSKLMPIDASISGSISRTSWSGIAQPDIGSVVRANMICRERAFEKLVALIQQPDIPPQTQGPKPIRPASHGPKHVSVRHVSRQLPVVVPGTPQAEIQAASVRAQAAAKRHDLKNALNNWLTAARLGDAQAQFEAAQLYDYGGPGVPADCAAATRWYRAAAAQDLAAANYNVGGEYYYGCKGLFPADHAEALRWLKKAVDEGSPDAEYEIGMIYYNGGAGVTKDSALAKNWLTKAASHGNLNARVALRNLGQV